MSTIVSAGLRTNEAPYLGPEGGRPGRPTLAVRHTCSGNLGIVKILRYIRSGMHIASATNSKLLCVKKLRVKVVHGEKRLRTTALNDA
jgi:hypothetical protein